jgi:microcystin-dependent protein
MSNSEKIRNDSNSRRGFISKLGALIAGATSLGFLGSLFPSNSAKAKTKNALLGSEDYLGSIGMVAFTFAPRGTALCNGQVLSIAQNTALFSLLGTTFGGNGTTNFNLPDLRSRVIIGAGQGNGLSSYVLGQEGGTEAVTLTVNQIPSHNHALNVNTGIGTSDTPSGNYLAENNEGIKQFTTSANGAANSSSIGNSGSSQPFTIVQPYLALNYVIVLEGIFPSRN